MKKIKQKSIKNMIIEMEKHRSILFKVNQLSQPLHDT